MNQRHRLAALLVLSLTALGAPALAQDSHFELPGSAAYALLSGGYQQDEESASAGEDLAALSLDYSAMESGSLAGDASFLVEGSLDATGGASAMLAGDPFDPSGGAVMSSWDGSVGMPMLAGEGSSAAAADSNSSPDYSAAQLSQGYSLLGR